MGQVLVADDNPLSLAFLSEAIRLAGHLATTAADGTRAVEAACCRQFDLLLLDTRMPGLDGPAALHSIRSGSGPSRRSPAVATSADAGISRPGLLDAGFGEVLVKPVAIDALHELLARYLGQGEPGDAVLLDKFVVDPDARGEGLTHGLWRLMIEDEPVVYWRSRQTNGFNGFYMSHADGFVRRGIWNIFWTGRPGLGEAASIIEDVAARTPSFIEDAS